jgi:hypothetical protein
VIEATFTLLPRGQPGNAAAPRPGRLPASKIVCRYLAQKAVATHDDQRPSAGKVAGPVGTRPQPTGVTT